MSNLLFKFETGWQDITAYIPVFKTWTCWYLPSKAQLRVTLRCHCNGECHCGSYKIEGEQITQMCDNQQNKAEYLGTVLQYHCP